MDVSCPECDTLYELDDRQLGGTEATTLQCSRCGHLFRLEPDTGVQSEQRRRWMVRQADSGDVLYFSGFDTLHQWIMDQKVGARDAVSRTGESWKRLGEIGEFAPIFQVVDSIADLSDSSDDEQQGDVDRKISEIRDVSDGEAGVSTTAPDESVGRASKPEDVSSTGRQGDSSRGGGGVSKSRTDSGNQRRANRDSKTTRPGKPGGVSSSESTSGPPEEKSRTGSDRDTERATTNRSRSGTPAERREVSESEGGTEGAERRPRKPTPGQRAGAERKSSSPEVQLEQGRFQSDGTEAGGEPEPSGEEGWTLGELEQRDSQKMPAVDEVSGRRRWPAVVVALLLGGVVAFGIWQRDAIEELALDVVDEWEGDESPEVVEISPDRVEVVVGEVAESVGEGVDSARSMMRVEVAGDAVATAGRGVEKALREGRERHDETVEDDRSQPQPTSVPDLASAGRAALQDGRNSEAVELFEQARSEAPDNAEVLTGLGWAYLAEGRVEEAVGKFENARRADPDLGDALIGLGRAERSRGRQRAALEAYEEYVERFPDGEQISIARYQRDQLREALEQ